MIKEHDCIVLTQDLAAEGLLTRQELPAGFEMQRDAMREFNLFVTVLCDEDIPYIMKYSGEDNLIVGSDYTHADSSQEMDFVQLLQERADRGEIPKTAVEKIVSDNPRKFYGL